MARDNDQSSEPTGPEPSPLDIASAALGDLNLGTEGEPADESDPLVEDLARLEAEQEAAEQEPAPGSEDEEEGEGEDDLDEDPIAGEEDEEGEEKGAGEEEEEEGEGGGKSVVGEVSIPSPRAARGVEGGGELVLKGLSQEAADAVRFHVKQSGRVTDLEARLETLSEHERTVAFLKEHPDLGLDMLAQRSGEHTGKFIENWVLQHPKEATELWEKLRIEEEEPRVLELLQEKAQKRTKERIEEGLREITSTDLARRFVEKSGQTIRGAIADLKLSEEDGKDFTDLAAARLRDLYGSKPQATRADMQEALQRIIQRFSPGGMTPRPSGPKEKRKDAKPDKRKAFQKKVDMTRRLQKSGGGAPISRALGSVKVPKGGGIDEANKALIDAL